MKRTAKRPRGARFRARARLRDARRRGVALLLSIFAMVVVGSTTVAYVASQDESMLIARNTQTAADSRTIAAAGLDVVTKLLRSGDSNWRTAHTNGRLLDNYAIDGGTVSVDLVDIERRNSGVANPYPVASSTKIEVTVNSTRGGNPWTTVADMSVPAVVKGQYAIFTQRSLTVDGSANFIGRWSSSPLNAQRLRVNIGTGATVGTAATALTVPPVDATGVWLKRNAVFETTVSGVTQSDPDTQKSTWVYYPYAGSSSVLQGAAATGVAAKRLDQGESAALIAAPSAPTATKGFTSYTSTQVVDAKTVSYTPFRIKAALLPTLNRRNFDIRNHSVVTLTAGTYEIWGSWIMRDSRIIIDGDVKIVVDPSLGALGLDWQRSTVELNSNASLDIFNGYSADIRECWVGSHFVCSADPSAANRDGDPNMREWMHTFQSTVCHSTAPTSPIYFEPWRIRLFPLPQYLSSTFSWSIQDTSLIGSIFLPTNAVNCGGTTKIYGRIACKDLYLGDSASIYYDHRLDEVSGLTTGSAPSRGGDPDQLFPTRVINYGFDAESAR